MTAFNLPDLGEGLKEAEVVKWLVKEGQYVQLDELILLVETAKAVVELPAPSAGVITRLVVEDGETVQVGQTLFEYDSKKQCDDNKVSETQTEKRESVSVVGEISQSTDEIINAYEIEKINDELALVKQYDYEKIPSVKAEPICLNTFKQSKSHKPKIETQDTEVERSSLNSPRTIAFAKKLGLMELIDHTYYGELSLHDLLVIYQDKLHLTNKEQSFSDNPIVLKGTRKVMAQVMTQAHQTIPSATLFDDADISHWSLKTDITLRIINAITSACAKVPIMNARYDSENMSIQQCKHIDLGLAVHSERGLFVPVIRQINMKKETEIRECINKFRQQINDETIQAKDLIGATITLSNFGALSGRYATPIIVPPQVCIIGIGKSTEQALVNKGKIQVGRILPISLSFDHRVATGGDAALFMQSLIQALEA